jgi:hypothetical protein
MMASENGWSKGGDALEDVVLVRSVCPYIYIQCPPQFYAFSDFLDFYHFEQPTSNDDNSINNIAIITNGRLNESWQSDVES